jgi:putative ABC transport system ATP-binding protein
MIVLKNVTKLYSKNGGLKIPAVDDVSLEIAKGSFVAITGPSGSGKTTLMNIIGLLDRPSSGHYSLDGHEVGSLADNETARLRNQKIGFVFQAFHLLPRTTAKENVELPLLYADHSPPGHQAVEILKTVGLAERLNHYPAELSGGEQQRVAIARALINNTEILLADEPTGNLDSQAGAEVMKIFQNLHRSGRTIILITHDPEVARHAQQVIRLADGKIANQEGFLS